MIYKVGSRGSEVTQIQKKVGVSSDGAYGPKTAEAVKQWQAAHGLDADGIVGPATWKAMFGTAQASKCVDPSVQYTPLSEHVTYSPHRPIKYLAIHFTAGSQSADCVRIIKHVFEERRASADFAVDDKIMAQYNPDVNNYYCWAVGDKKDTSGGGGRLYGQATNKNTISIEICSTHKHPKQGLHSNGSDFYFTEAAINNAVRLAKILMKKFNIDLDHVVRHYDISGKLCPGIIGWNNGRLYDEASKRYTSERNNSTEWEKFKNRLK